MSYGIIRSRRPCRRSLSEVSAHLERASAASDSKVSVRISEMNGEQHRELVSQVIPYKEALLK